MKFTEISDKECTLEFDHKLTFEISEDTIKITGNADFFIENVIARQSDFVPKLIECTENQVTLEHLEKRYGLSLEQGKFISHKTIASTNKQVIIKILQKL